MPMKLRMNGRPLMGAIAGNLMVADRKRHPLAGARLFRAFLEGGQEVSLSDTAGDTTRAMWDQAGGATCISQSLRWFRPLAPVGGMAARIRHGWLAPLGLILKYPAQGLDRLANRCAGGHLPAPPQGYAETDLDEAGVLSLLREYAGLRPDYDEGVLRWLLQHARAKQQYGPLVQRGVADRRGRLVGWFMYYSRAGKTARVLQWCGGGRSLPAVVDLLMRHAAASGATALEARVAPADVPVLCDRGGFLMQRKQYVCVHTARAEVVQAMDRGHAFFTRLEGDWWTQLMGDDFV
jgi:hypothetical protein